MRDIQCLLLKTVGLNSIGEGKLYEITYILTVLFLNCDTNIIYTHDIFYITLRVYPAY